MLVNEGHESDRDARGRWIDFTLSVDQVLYASARWLPVITVLTFLPYLLIWGLPAVPAWPGLATALWTVLVWSALALVVYAVSAVVHEVLHLAAMVLVARVPVSSLEYGMRLSEGILYVHTDHPMSARTYRIVLILPAVVLGLVPAGVGILHGSGWLVLYGYVMLISAIGDLIVLEIMRHVPAETAVRDHPKAIGCQVWATS